MVGVVDELAAYECGCCDPYGWQEGRWHHGTVVDEVSPEQSDAHSYTWGCCQCSFEWGGLVFVHVVSIHIIPNHHMT